MLAGFATDRKIELAKELERLAARRRFARARRRRQLQRRRRRERGGHHERHPPVAVARTAATSASARSPTTATRRRPASASASAARPTSSISPRRRRRPPTGPPVCSAPPSPAAVALTVVLDPFVTAQFLGVISSTLNGESVVKGRSLFKDRVGEQVASPLFTLVDDPTNPLAYTATDLDGEGLAARRNVLDRRRRAARVRAQQLQRPSRRHASAPATPCAAGSRARPVSAAWRCSCSRARVRRPSSSRDVERRRARAVGVRVCTAV